MEKFRASLLILLEYDAPVFNLFWTHTKAIAMDVVLVLSDENHLLCPWKFRLKRITRLYHVVPFVVVWFLVLSSCSLEQ